MLFVFLMDLLFYILYFVFSYFSSFFLRPFVVVFNIHNVKEGAKGATNMLLSYDCANSIIYIFVIYFDRFLFCLHFRHSSQMYLEKFDIQWYWVINNNIQRSVLLHFSHCTRTMPQCHCRSSFCSLFSSFLLKIRYASEILIHLLSVCVYSVSPFVRNKISINFK